MEEKEKLIVFSTRITKENKEMLDLIKDELDCPSMNDVIENLIHRFRSPIKVNEDNLVRIKQLENDLVVYKETNCNIIKLENEIESLHKENEQLKTEMKELMSKQKLPENTYIMWFTPLNDLCLQYVANKFTKQKKCKKEWNPQMVINYFIEERLIKGTFNGDIDSVPDYEIKEFVKQLKEKECLN